MEEKFINDIVEYIVTDPGHNMTQAAEHFKCSRPTIKKYIAMLSDEKNLYYNQFKAMRVKISLEKQLSLISVNIFLNSSLTFLEKEPVLSSIRKLVYSSSKDIS